MHEPRPVGTARAIIAGHHFPLISSAPSRGNHRALTAENSPVFSSSRLYRGYIMNGCERAREPVPPPKERIDDTTREPVGQTALWEEGVRCFCVVRNNNHGSACPDFQHAAQLRWPGRRIATCRAGNLYGTTVGGGASSRGGTIFKIAPNGALTTLYSFCSQSGCSDGAYPYAGLAQATSGELYGTTMSGWDQPTGHGLQNRSEWRTDHATQLLLPQWVYGRQVTHGGAGTSR